LERPKSAKKNKREEWETEELRTLFESPVYAEHERPKGGAGEASYWLPILALYHGFRAGELCQLDTADVLKKAGVWCLSIRPSAEDAETDADRHGKSVKTDTSIRVVPLHSAVIALGFLDYVQSVKGRKLFPRIKVDSIGRWSGNWSKWFSRYRNDIGLGGRWRDFHSFRHGWKTAARGAGIPKDIHDEITGHENGDVGSGYGKFHRITGYRTGQSNSRGVGWEFVHACPERSRRVAIDDASRVAFSRVMKSERKGCAIAFLKVAVAYYASLGITVERVMTDNGSCCKAFAFRRACKRLGLRHIRTRPYTPRTNGKAEHFIQTALRQWAYARAYDISRQRAAELPYWMHRYNWHRPHASIGSVLPISTLRLTGKNLLKLQT
jgi:hypothetical protein